ncbi:MAG: hypothetical protein V1792_12565 [Pseudomonadota bacterium]
MTRIFVAVLLMVLGVGAACLSWAENSQDKLIQVKPAYEDAAAPTHEVRNPNEPPPPAPRDQLYVFWILGRILSYPIDTAESYVSGWLERRRNQPAAQPASASAAQNPFNSIGLREIPPAPPAESPAH